jgi:hypothetical protein
MIKKTNFLSIAGISLIIISSYYFYNYTKLAPKNYNIFLFDLIFLSIFSYFFFFIFIRIIENFENFYLLKIFFFSYLFVQTLKAFIFLANSEMSLSGIIINFIDFFQFNLTVKKRIFLFLMPYMFFFGILFFTHKIFKKFDYIKFFKITGFVLFFFVIYREFFYLKSVNLVLSDNKINHYSKNNFISKKKVVWVIFDGFDPQIYDEYKDKLNLKNLKKFENKSVYVPSAISPDYLTVVSVPSLILGEEGIGKLIKNRKYFLRTKQQSFIELNFENTIFGQIYKNGFNSSILSSSLQYCSSYIRTYKFYKCKETNTYDQKLELYKFFSGIKFATSYEKFLIIYKKIFKKDKSDQIFKINLKDILQASPNKKLENSEDLDGYNTVFMSDYIDALKYSNLTFLHLFIPHPGNLNYMNRTFNIKNNDDFFSHLLNLRLTDITLEKIYTEIKKYDDYLIIISSDHWFRAKDNNPKNIYPSLFMAKTNDDDNSFRSELNFKNVHINELIQMFLNGKINNNKDIKLFVENKL